MSFNVLNKRHLNRISMFLTLISISLNIVLIEEHNWLKKQIYSYKWLETRVRRMDTNCSTTEKLTENLLFALKEF